MKTGQTPDGVASLREAVLVRARGRCEWPEARVEAVAGYRIVACGRPMIELAHLHSRGMGGSVEADQLNNVIAACAVHARVTDGIGPGANIATEAMFRVVGYGEDWTVGAFAWHRAEALRQYVESVLTLEAT